MSAGLCWADPPTVSAPFPIYEAAGATQYGVAVGATADGFEVFWSDNSGISELGATPWDVKANVVLPGETPAVTSFGIAPGQGDQDMPRAASDGDSLFVVWEHYFDPVSEVRGRQLALGASGGEGGTSYSEQGTFGGDDVAIAWGGDYYLVAWNSPGIVAVRVAPGGNPVDAAPISIRNVGGVTHPRVATDGTDFLVVWQEDSPGIPVVRAARVAQADGSVLDADPIEIPNTPETSQQSPDVAFSDGFYLVVFGQAPSYPVATDIESCLLAPDGSIARSTQTISQVTDTQTRPSVVALDGGYLVVWEDLRPITGDTTGPRAIWGVQVDHVVVTGDVSYDDWVVQDPWGFMIASDEGIDRSTPSLAVIGRTALVAWTETDDPAVPDSAVWGAFVTLAEDDEPGDVDAGTGGDEDAGAVVADGGGGDGDDAGTPPAGDGGGGCGACSAAPARDRWAPVLLLVPLALLWLERRGRASSSGR
ncbi:MAG: hypothetical protein HYY06_25540 [Deltaproteobacteria bacterium]|nr:hypothetical protein [Deltaproteobacteria bacterium]